LGKACEFFDTNYIVLQITKKRGLTV